MTVMLLALVGSLLAQDAPNEDDENDEWTQHVAVSIKLSTTDAAVGAYAPVKWFPVLNALAAGCRVDPMVSKDVPFWSAHCPHWVRTREGITEARIDVEPWDRALREAGARSVHFGIEASGLGFAADYDGKHSGWHRYNGWLTGSGNTKGARLTPVTIRFGWTRQDWLLRAAAVLGFSVGPILVVCWWRRRAWAGIDAGDLALAFRYEIWLGLLLSAVWLLWMGCAGMLDLNAAIADYISSPWLRLPASLLVFTGPALAGLVVSEAVWETVRARLRNRAARPGHAALSSLLESGQIVLPLGLVLAAPSQHGMGGVGGCVLGAYGLWKLLSWLSAKHQQFEVVALTTGEMRDRIFALAQRAGVALRQIYLLRPRRTEEPNAFALTGGMVMMSQELVELFSRRELEAVMAHELGHIKHKHVNAQIIAVVITMGGGMLLSPLLAKAGLNLGLAFQAVMALGLPIAGMLIGAAVSRRNEFQADAFAGTLTGDAEAMITALVKLARMSYAPLYWSKAQGAILTHPSMQARIERLTKLGGISSERLEELLALPVEEAAYSAAGLEESPDRENELLFSTKWKHAHLQMQTWVTRLVRMALPLLAMHFAWWSMIENNRIGFSRIQLLVLMVGVIPVAVLLNDWLGMMMSHYAQRRLSRRLSEKLGQPGRAPGVAPGMAVGLAPDATVRVYEGFDDWDIGLLEMAPGQLIYRGERTSFVLDTEMIQSIELIKGLPSWIPSYRTRVAWRNQMAGTGGVFHLGAYDVTARQMHRELLAWREGPSKAAEDLARLASGMQSWSGLVLPLPRFGEVTSIAPRDAVRWPGVLAGMAGTLLLTMMVSMATGQLIAPLASFIAPLIYGAEHLPVLLSRRSPM